MWSGPRRAGPQNMGAAEGEVLWLAMGQLSEMLDDREAALGFYAKCFAVLKPLLTTRRPGIMPPSRLALGCGGFYYRTNNDGPARGVSRIAIIHNPTQMHLHSSIANEVESPLAKDKRKGSSKNNSADVNRGGRVSSSSESSLFRCCDFCSTMLDLFHCRSIAVFGLSQSATRL